MLFNVRPDLLCGSITGVAAAVSTAVSVTVFATITALVTVTVVLCVSHDATAEDFPIKLRPRNLSVKLFMLFLQEGYMIIGQFAKQNRTVLLKSFPNIDISMLLYMHDVTLLLPVGQFYVHHDENFILS